MPHRFFVPQLPAENGMILEGSEAHHLVHVLRLKPGQEVVLFDGTGQEAVASIDNVSQGTAALQVTERRVAQTETAIPIILGTAVPKGDRFAWLVEKATELGISRIVPLNTQRSIVDPGTGKLEKLRHAVVAASKQCGRSRLMTIDAPVTWRDFVTREFSQGTVYIAHPSGENFGGMGGKEEQPLKQFVLAVGPEGGFTDAELEQGAEAGGKLLSLGPRILRIETAGLALATLFASRS